MKQIVYFNATVLSIFFFAELCEYMFLRGYAVLGIIVLALASLLVWFYYYCPYKKITT